MMKRLIMLGLCSLSVAQAADWDVMALLNNLKSKGKIADVKASPAQQVNQKKRVNYQVSMKQDKEQNTFQITGKTSQKNLVFQHFDLQLDNFLTLKKSQAYSTQAGFMQSLLLGISQVCFAFNDQENAAVGRFFTQTLNHYAKQGKAVQASKTFALVTAAVSINDQSMRLTVENRVPVRKDQCSLLE